MPFHELPKTKSETDFTGSLIFGLLSFLDPVNEFKPTDPKSNRMISVRKYAILDIWDRMLVHNHTDVAHYLCKVENLPKTKQIVSILANPSYKLLPLDKHQSTPESYLSPFTNPFRMNEPLKRCLLPFYTLSFTL